MAEIYRVLDDGGKLAVCVTKKQHIENKRFAKQLLGLYEDTVLYGMLEQAGFKEMEISKYSDRYWEFVCITSKKKQLTA